MAQRILSLLLRPRNMWAITSRPCAPRLMSTESGPPPKDSPDESILKAGKYKPTPMERKFFVWTGKYKAIDDVPKYVTHEQMERTKNLIRIYGTTIMMVLTLICSIIMIRSGRAAKDRGESLTKMNVEWHKAQKEQNNK